nr:NADPH-dependent oxidoreductase [Corynebacterium pseudotuberculosis]
MNETIRTQLNHRTIREFTTQPIAEEILEQIFQVALHTPTSLGMQTASIIRVTDPQLREQLTAIGTQEYVGRAPVLPTFLSFDLHRTKRILANNNAPTEPAGYPRNFVQGFTDACLMAQNVCIAAESLGLGVNFLGNVHNDAAAVIDVLDLPELTFPVVGMTLGWPNQSPQLKPRMPKSFRIMENGYSEPTDWSEAMSSYDSTMTTYYDLRNANQRVDSFTIQTLQKNPLSKDNRDLTFEIARAQGFDL